MAVRISVARLHWGAIICVCIRGGNDLVDPAPSGNSRIGAALAERFNCRIGDPVKSRHDRCVYRLGLEYSRSARYLSVNWILRGEITRLGTRGVYRDYNCRDPPVTSMDIRRNLLGRFH